MRPQHYTMTPEVIYRHAANLLQAQLRWVNYGRKCTVKTLFLVLFYAAGQLCSLSMACQRLPRGPPAIRRCGTALRALCPPLEVLEQQLNSSFAAQLPKALRQRRQRVAIDSASYFKNYSMAKVQSKTTAQKNVITPWRDCADTWKKGLTKSRLKPVGPLSLTGEEKKIGIGRKTWKNWTTEYHYKRNANRCKVIWDGL